MSTWNPGGPPDDPSGQQPQKPQQPNYGQQPPPPSYGAPAQQPGYGQQPPPPGYGQQPAAYPGVSGFPPAPVGSGAPQTKGFFGSLFDFSFTNFAAPKIIRIVYVLVVIAIGLGYLITVIAAFSENGGLGIVALILGAIFAIVELAWIRLVLELFMAIFRIADDVQAIRRRQGA